MYIMVENKQRIFNTDFVWSFAVSKYPDCAAVIASYGTRDGDCKTITRYKDAKEAEDALAELFAAIAGGQTYFYMPGSTYYSEEKIKKMPGQNARVVREGKALEERAK